MSSTGIDRNTTGDFVGPDALYTINAGTGAVTYVGVTGLWGIQGLEFSSDGTLYGWDVGHAKNSSIVKSGLVTINTSSGVATDVNPNLNNGADPSIQTLAFSLDGSQLFGAGSGLYSVNKSDGTIAAIGGPFWNEVYIDIRGIGNH